MTPNEMEDPYAYVDDKEPVKPARSKSRSKILLFVALIILAVNAASTFFQYRNAASVAHKASNASLVTFAGPAGAYHLQYDPSLFHRVSDPVHPNVVSFESKDGHTGFTATDARVVEGPGLIYYADQQYYRELDPSLYVSGQLDSEYFVISAETFRLSKNQHFAEALSQDMRTWATKKFRMHYDDNCDSSCVASLKHTSDSFMTSSPR
jgi:hypothetical protein